LFASKVRSDMEENIDKLPPPPAVQPADPRDLEERFDRAMRRLARSGIAAPDAEPEPAPPDTPSRDDF
jgi:hypothetical protein